MKGLLIKDFYMLMKYFRTYLIIIVVMSLITMFSYEQGTILTVIFTLLAVSIKMIIDKIKKKRVKCIKEDEKNKTGLPIGFYLCVTNIITLLTYNFIAFYNL